MLINSKKLTVLLNLHQANANEFFNELSLGNFEIYCVEMMVKFNFENYK